MNKFLLGDKFFHKYDKYLSFGLPYTYDLANPKPHHETVFFQRPALG